MARSWLERLAKRIGRLSQTLDDMESKGQSSTADFNKKIDEMVEMVPQVIKAYDDAKAKLHQANVDAIFSRRKAKKQQDKLNADRVDMEEELAEMRAKLKREIAEVNRQLGEVIKERADLADKLQAAKSEKAKYTKAMETMRKAAAAL